MIKLGKFLICASLCMFLSVNSVFAQASGVALAGRLSYRINVQTGTASASVEQLANYSMQTFGNVKLVLILSKSGYVEGKSLKGTEIASAQLGAFPARSFFSNLSLNGQTRIPKVSNYRLVLAAISGKTILNAVNFKNKVSVKNASVKRILAKAEGTINALGIGK